MAFINLNFRQALWLFALFVLVSFSAAAQTPAPQTIRVKAGGPATVVKGRIIKGQLIVFEFEAKAGQKFIGRLTQKKSGNAGFDIQDPDGEALPEMEYDFYTNFKRSLTKSGTYKIIITTFRNHLDPFTMSVKITK